MYECILHPHHAWLAFTIGLIVYRLKSLFLTLSIWSLNSSMKSDELWLPSLCCCNTVLYVRLSFFMISWILCMSEVYRSSSIISSSKMAESIMLDFFGYCLFPPLLLWILYRSKPMFTRKNVNRSAQSTIRSDKLGHKCIIVVTNSTTLVPESFALRLPRLPRHALGLG